MNDNGRDSAGIQDPGILPGDLMTAKARPPAGLPAAPERSPGQKDDPELNARFEARVQKETQDKAAQMTLAQRLTRRARTQTIKIPFEDDVGTFYIEVRIPMAAELDELLSLENRIKMSETTPNQVQEIEEASNELYTKLADLAVDPSLNFDFFKAGAFLGSDLAIIMKEILVEENNRVEQAQKFRAKSGRA